MKNLVHTEYESWWEVFSKRFNDKNTWSRANGIQFDTAEGFLKWMGGLDAPDRKLTTKLFNEDSKTFLDVGCGVAHEYFALKHYKCDYHYTGVDITPEFVRLAQEEGIPVYLSSAEDIIFYDSTFDIVHMRHVVEHMNNFERPISEMIRVGKEQVIISFFIKPTSKPTWINCEQSQYMTTINKDMVIYNNRYNKESIERLLSTNKKVHSWEWHDLNPDMKGDRDVNDNNNDIQQHDSSILDITLVKD